MPIGLDGLRLRGDGVGGGGEFAFVPENDRNEGDLECIDGDLGGGDERKSCKFNPPSSFDHRFIKFSRSGLDALGEIVKLARPLGFDDSSAATSDGFGGSFKINFGTFKLSDVAL